MWWELLFFPTAGGFKCLQVMRIGNHFLTGLPDTCGYNPHNFSGSIFYPKLFKTSWQIFDGQFWLRINFYEKAKKGFVWGTNLTDDRNPRGPEKLSTFPKSYRNPWEKEGSVLTKYVDEQLVTLQIPLSQNPNHFMGGSWYPRISPIIPLSF